MGTFEDICTKCGACCLKKIKHPYLSKPKYTNVACDYLNPDCTCSIYEDRKEIYGCETVNLDDLSNLPTICAYRGGKGESIKGRFIQGVPSDQLHEHTIDWIHA